MYTVHKCLFPNVDFFVLRVPYEGRGKGTPMLKEGVRMVEALPNPEDSDNASDWKGF